MKQKTHFHLSHYILLIVILLGGLLMFYFFLGNSSKQFITIIATSSCYVLWGIYHHKAEGDLHPKIVVEYLLIALLAILLIKGAIFG